MRIMNYTIFNTPVLKTLIRWLCLTVINILGWRIEGTLPKDRKFVMIAAPHTSNWDLPMMLAIAFCFRLKLHWYGKKSIFNFPFGTVMQWLGGIPVDRTKSNNLASQSIDIFNSNRQLALAVQPEGTRKKVNQWKTGFYHIAHGAGVPIVLGFMDFKRKTGGVGGSFMPSGDIDTEMAKIRKFYKGIIGKNPSKTSNVEKMDE